MKNDLINAVQKSFIGTSDWPELEILSLPAVTELALASKLSQLNLIKQVDKLDCVIALVYRQVSASGGSGAGAVCLNHHVAVKCKSAALTWD